MRILSQLFGNPVMVMLEEDGGGGGGGSGGTPDPVALFQSSIPEDIRKEANISTFKSAADLAKSYVDAQKLIGQNRLPMPAETWDDAKWDEFFGKIGRPGTPDEYPDPSIKPLEGVTLPPETLKEIKGQIHKLGLTKKQGQGLLEYYIGSINKQFETVHAETTARMGEAQTALKKDWGNDYDFNMKLARSVVQSFGGPELLATLQDAGLDNDPQLIKAFAKMGKSMMEDSATGSGKNLITTDETQARSEIDTLRTDKQFMDAYLSREHTGHKAAVDRMTRLMSVAYPGKSS